MIAITVVTVLAWIGLLAYISARIVDAGSIAVVFRFGNFNRVLQPGLNFIIPFVERTENYSTQTRQFELPDEPEKIDRDHKTAESGKTLPIRVVHKGMAGADFYVRKEYNPDEPDGLNPFDNTRSFEELKWVRFNQLPPEIQEALRDDLINAPLTSEVSGVIEWHLNGRDEESIRNFIENVHPEGERDRVQEVRKRATDMVTRVLQEHVSPTTLGHAIYMAPVFNALIRREMEFLVGEKEDPRTQRPWGIHIDKAYLKPFDPGKTINKARAEAESEKYKTVRASEAAATATRNQAVADKDRLIAEGEGERQRQIAINTATEDRLIRVILPAAVNETTSEVFRSDREAAAYENNETITTWVNGGNPGVFVGK